MPARTISRVLEDCSSLPVVCKMDFAPDDAPEEMKSQLQRSAATKYSPFFITVRLVDGKSIEKHRFIQILSILCPGVAVSDNSDHPLAIPDFNLQIRDFLDFKTVTEVCKQHKVEYVCSAFEGNTPYLNCVSLKKGSMVLATMMSAFKKAGVKNVDQIFLLEGNMEFPNVSSFLHACQYLDSIKFQFFPFSAKMLTKMQYMRRRYSGNDWRPHLRNLAYVGHLCSDEFRQGLAEDEGSFGLEDARLNAEAYRFCLRLEDNNTEPPAPPNTRNNSPEPVAATAGVSRQDDDGGDVSSRDHSASLFSDEEDGLSPDNIFRRKYTFYILFECVYCCLFSLSSFRKPFLIVKISLISFLDVMAIFIRIFIGGALSAEDARFFRSPNNPDTYRPYQATEAASESDEEESGASNDQSVSHSASADILAGEIEDYLAAEYYDDGSSEFDYYGSDESDVCDECRDLDGKHSIPSASASADDDLQKTDDVDNVKDCVDNVTDDVDNVTKVSDDVTKVADDVDNVTADIDNVSDDVTKVADDVDNVTADVDNVTADVSDDVNNIEDLEGAKICTCAHVSTRQEEYVPPTSTGVTRFTSSDTVVSTVAISTVDRMTYSDFYLANPTPPGAVKVEINDKDESFLAESEVEPLKPATFDSGTDSSTYFQVPVCVSQPQDSDVASPAVHCASFTIQHSHMYTQAAETLTVVRHQDISGKTNELCIVHVYLTYVSYCSRIYCENHSYNSVFLLFISNLLILQTASRLLDMIMRLPVC